MIKITKEENIKQTCYDYHLEKDGKELFIGEHDRETNTHYACETHRYKHNITHKEFLHLGLFTYLTRDLIVEC